MDTVEALLLIGIVGKGIIIALLWHDVVLFFRQVASGLIRSLPPFQAAFVPLLVLSFLSSVVRSVVRLLRDRGWSVPEADVISLGIQAAAYLGVAVLVWRLGSSSDDEGE